MTVKKDDPWHCPNGHLAFHTLQGKGCVVHDCPHRLPQFKQKETKK
jgi:hypothetical protein